MRSDFSKLVHPMLEPLGKNHHESWPKSGSIRFDFDKEWIGAKGYVPSRRLVSAPEPVLR